MTQSLANKYRSSTFDDLVGQDHISHILKYQVAHHTRQANYLFFGPRGTGKTSSARLFAKAINCLSTTDGNPCNVCENCIAISKGTTMDIMEIDAASHTGVDNIREEIIDKLMYRPSMLKKRVTIIDEVHMLSKGAFNALLKTMEEPTEWMVFILATTELTKVPDTIVSRCQVFNFKKIPSSQIIDRLEYIANQESITNSQEGLSMIADLSDGCMRDAVKYLDQISVMGEVNETNVSQFLGVVSDASIARIIHLYDSYTSSQTDSDFAELITAIEQLGQQGVDLTLLPKQLMSYADRHFNENRQLYTTISTLSSQLLSQAKRYPHPLLLYKTLLYNNKTTTENSQPINPVTTKKQPTQFENMSGSNSSATPFSSYHQKEGQTNKEETLEQKNETSESTPLTQAIILLSPSLQKLLSGQSELVSINNGVAKLIITNSLAKLTLNKKETQDSICSAITSTSGQTVTSLELSFMTKEEYFSYQMGSL
ncbi:DNA polymerase III subunit tau [candidate division SR1 bacterium Aalborg_AAW-1]|nr:DNA polymerase III subunit tau [candidate division SR1 bacterium Aalborg_AAW-1]